MFDDESVPSIPVNMTIHIYKRPIARITSILPNEVYIGELIQLKGECGTDSDPLNYTWYSDLQGDLHHGPQDSAFFRGSIPGEHIITLKVQDEFGFWSHPVTEKVFIKPLSLVSITSSDISIIGPGKTDSNHTISAVFHNACEYEVDLFIHIYVKGDDLKVFTRNLTLESHKNDSITVEWTPREEGEYLVNIVISTSNPDDADPSDNQAYRTVIISEGEQSKSSIPDMLPFIILVGIVCTTMAVVTVIRTERGTFWAFSMLSPLYSRIRRENAEDSVSRAEIMGYLRQYPGANYTTIKKDLGYSNGRLTYHLIVLENTYKIKVRNDGIHKKFYPRDFKLPAGDYDFLPSLQKEIVEFLSKYDKVNQNQIARTLGKNRRTVAYHLNKLVRSRLVILEKRGRVQHYSLDRMAK